MSTASTPSISTATPARAGDLLPATVPDNPQRALIGTGLFGLALLARILGGLYFGTSGPLANDEPEYYYPAVSIAEGTGYQKVPQQSPDGVAKLTAYRVPGPMFFMALCFKLFGTGIAKARWISMIVASTSAPIMFFLARSFIPRPAAVLAGVACAIYPTWVYQSLFILSEPYFIPAMLLAMLFTAKAFTARSTASAGLAGIAWGMTALVRPHGLIVGVLLAAWFWRRVGWRQGLLLAAGLAACVFPWLIRNAVVMHHPVLLATEGGETLLGANNPYVLNDPKQHGMWLSPMAIPEYREHLRPIRDEVQRDREQSAMAKTFLKQHLSALPRLVCYKLWRWLTPLTVTGGVVRLLVLASYGSLLLALAIGGLRLHVFRSSILLAQVLICTAVFALVTCVYWGGLTRGRVPLEVIWLPYGAFAAWQLLCAARRRKAALPAGARPA